MLGSHNLSVRVEKGRSYVGVDRIEIHPDWNPSSESYDADIAILTLSDDISFTRYIKPICLPSLNTSIEVIADGFVVGHGKSEDETKHYEDVQKFIKIPIHKSNEECFYTNEFLLKLSSIRTFCGGSRDGSGVCMGDSGNGLFVNHFGLWYLRGIVSASLFTNNECDLYNYSIFTNILKFRDWIYDKITR